MLVPQLVNASTSFAAMLEEARAAESRRDFISKCSIVTAIIRNTRRNMRAATPS